MSDLSFMEHLVDDAKREIGYLQKYEEEVEKAGRDNSRWASVVWKMRVPSKQRIKDDLKMIRRISLEIERSLQ